jgi:hypothetical protein
MQHFAVMAMPRSGSTRLCNILGQHPAIACHQEIFHPDEVQAFFTRDRPLEIMDRARRDADPKAFLDRFIDLAETWFKGRAHHGFKVVFNNRQTRAATQVVGTDPRFNKIVLRRDNLLACYTSLRLAIETGVWQRVEGEAAANREHMLLFEPIPFRAFAGRSLMARAAIMDTIRRGGQRYIELEYAETLTAEGLERAWGFFGVPAIAERGAIRKTNTRPLLECYCNPDAVRAEMEEIGRIEWLAGDDPILPAA